MPSKLGASLVGPLTNTSESNERVQLDSAVFFDDGFVIQRKTKVFRKTGGIVQGFENSHKSVCRRFGLGVLQNIASVGDGLGTKE